MKPAELNALMHAVLDGEATPDEARELEHALAADPATRRRFEDWRELWDGLGRIEQAYPPEGLVASVMADLPPRAARAGRRPTFLDAGCNCCNFKGIPGHKPGNVNNGPRDIPDRTILQG